MVGLRFQKYAGECECIMYFRPYHPENRRDTDNAMKWTLSRCYWSLLNG